MRLRGQGFSLIELIIAVAIMGVLLGLGLPALSTYARNIKLRAAAESFLAAVSQARGEAVSLNANVELILTNSAPVTDDGSDSDYPELYQDEVDQLGATVQTGKRAVNRPVAHASSSADPSYNWVVRTLPAAGGACGANPGPDPGQQAKACWLISGKRGAETSGGSATDSGSGILIVGPGSIAFSPLGGAVPASDFDFSYPGGGNCVLAGGSMRCLRVRVERGGRTKLCDPAATTPGDTRGC
jgi:type IV fimbrial biogenesis protein FimT